MVQLIIFNTKEENRIVVGEHVTPCGNSAFTQSHLIEGDEPLQDMKESAAAMYSSIDDIEYDENEIIDICWDRPNKKAFFLLDRKVQKKKPDSINKVLLIAELSKVVQFGDISKETHDLAEQKLREVIGSIII